MRNFYNIFIEGLQSVVKKMDYGLLKLKTLQEFKNDFLI